MIIEQKQWLKGKGWLLTRGSEQVGKPQLVLKQRVVKEIRNVFGDKTMITGFYSYGDVCQIVRNSEPRFSNRTMTITTFIEE